MERKIHHRKIKRFDACVPTLKRAFKDIKEHIKWHRRMKHLS